MGLCLPLVLAAATVLVCLTPGLLAASIMNDITAGPGSLQPRILVLGDSLAEEGAGRDGWVSQLHSEYEGSVGMFNLGTSLPNAQGERCTVEGDDVSSYLYLMPAILMRYVCLC